MIVKELLEHCSAKGVAHVVAQMAQCPIEEMADLENRCQQIVAELMCTSELFVLEDTDFCFVGVKTNQSTNVPRVVLTSRKELLNNRNDLKKTSHYSWFWGQTLGIWVDENSVTQWGADAMVGGILYHLMYFDQTEEQMKPLRETAEKELAGKEFSMQEFYVALNLKFGEKS